MRKPHKVLGGMSTNRCRKGEESTKGHKEILFYWISWYEELPVEKVYFYTPVCGRNLHLIFKVGDVHSIVADDRTHCTRTKDRRLVQPKRLQANNLPKHTV